VIEEDIKIVNRLGIHARPAAMIAQDAGRFKSDVFIIKDDMEVNAKSIMGIMMLAAEQGSLIRLIIKGEDEKDAFESLKFVFGKIAEEDK